MAGEGRAKRFRRLRICALLRTLGGRVRSQSLQSLTELARREALSTSRANAGTIGELTVGRKLWELLAPRLPHRHF